MWSLYAKINIVGCCMLRLVLLNLLELLKLCVSCDCRCCSGSGWLSSCGGYLSFSGCCFWVEILWWYYVVGNVGSLPFSWVFREFCFSLLYVVFALLVLVKLCSLVSLSLLLDLFTCGESNMDNFCCFYCFSSDGTVFCVWSGNTYLLW